MGKKSTVVTAVILISIIIIYAIVVFIMYDTKTVLFRPWDSDPPPNGTLILVHLSRLTSDEMDQQSQLMKNAIVPK